MRQIGERFFCDGGLRQNTPLSPALRLGADKVLVIGLRHKPPPVSSITGMFFSLLICEIQWENLNTMKCA